MHQIKKILTVALVSLLISSCASVKERIHARTAPTHDNVFNKKIESDGSKLGTRTVFEPISLDTEAAIAKFDADFRQSCAVSVNTLVDSVMSNGDYAAPNTNDLEESAQIVRETMRGMAEFKRVENQLKMAQFHAQAIQACNEQPNAYAAQMHAAETKKEKSIARTKMYGGAFTSIAKAATTLGLGSLAFGALTIASGGSISYGPTSTGTEVIPSTGTEAIQ